MKDHSIFELIWKRNDDYNALISLSESSFSETITSDFSFSVGIGEEEGELIDIDGQCGGYNIGYCLCSGYLIGKEIIKWRKDLFY